MTTPVLPASPFRVMFLPVLGQAGTTLPVEYRGVENSSYRRFLPHGAYRLTASYDGAESAVIKFKKGTVTRDIITIPEKSGGGTHRSSAGNHRPAGAARRASGLSCACCSSGHNRRASCSQHLDYSDLAAGAVV